MIVPVAAFMGPVIGSYWYVLVPRLSRRGRAEALAGLPEIVEVGTWSA